MNKKPVHEIRISLIKASIWENQGAGETPRYNVSLCKIYKDANEWKTSESFGRDDLLLVAKVADHAHSWICDQRPVKEQPREQARPA